MDQDIKGELEMIKSRFTKDSAHRLRLAISMDELRHLCYLSGGVDGENHCTEEEYHRIESELAKKYGFKFKE